MSPSFEKVPGTVVGNALPDILVDIQDATNAALRSLINNMSIASGPQVVVNDDRIAENENGDELYPWKRWHVETDPLGANNGQQPITFFQPDIATPRSCSVSTRNLLRSPTSCLLSRATLLALNDWVAPGARRRALRCSWAMRRRSCRPLPPTSTATSSSRPSSELYDMVMLTDQHRAAARRRDRSPCSASTWRCSARPSASASSSSCRSPPTRSTCRSPASKGARQRAARRRRRHRPRRRGHRPAGRGDQGDAAGRPARGSAGRPGGTWGSPRRRPCGARRISPAPPGAPQGPQTNVVGPTPGPRRHAQSSTRTRLMAQDYAKTADTPSHRQIAASPMPSPSCHPVPVPSAKFAGPATLPPRSPRAAHYENKGYTSSSRAVRCRSRRSRALPTAASMAVSPRAMPAARLRRAARARRPSCSAAARTSARTTASCRSSSRSGRYARHGADGGSQCRN